MPSEAADPPALAVITHDSKLHLRDQLPSLVAVAEELGTRVVVVDNASRDGTTELLRRAAQETDQLSFLELPANLGYAAAVNRAVAALGTSDVLVLNPDVELPDAGPVRDLASLLRRRPQAGLVAPRLVGADGAVQPSARRVASLGAMLGSLPTVGAAPPLRRAYERYLEPSGAQEVVSVAWVIGAAMLIRRAAYDVVGGFDPSFFLYMEDADFCQRLRRRGWDVLYAPTIRVQHGYARASSARGASLIGSPARRRHFRSLARYWRKHPLAAIGRDG